MTIHASEDIVTGESLAALPAVSEAIDAILVELARAQEPLTGARPGAPHRAGPYEQHLRRQAEAKGRDPHYPYLGSGLGRGPLVQLADGSVKWDMICGIGVHAFGHSDPDLVATALRAALCDTVMQGNLQYNAEAVEMAELLLAEAGRDSRLAHCFLINSGALANESALKVCFQHNAPADRVLAFTGAFTGRTTTMVQIGDSPAGRAGLPVTTQVDYVPFFDTERPEASTAEALRRLRSHLERYPGRHACFVMELIQGEGGFNTAPHDFFEALCRCCREHGVAVWIDEVQTFGRTTEMFYFRELGLGEHVDVVTVGKLSQVCACLYTAEYNPRPGLLSATFVGSTVALSVGRRILERLRDGGYYGAEGRIAGLQRDFRRRAERLVADHPGWFPPVELPDGTTSTRFLDGVGGMMRLTPFGGDRERVMAALHRMFDAGVIAFYCGRGPYHIRFLPPVGVFETRHFDEVLTIVEAALAATAPDG